MPIVDYYKASDLYDYVLEVITDEDGSPLPRRELFGLRLRQIVDAIKMRIAQLYLEGSIPREALDDLKERWGVLEISLPTVFVRNEHWDKFQHLDEPERRLRILGAAISAWNHKERMDEEELEIYKGESIAGFINYLKNLPNLVDDPWQHVLGHLSQGVIYIDDAIPKSPQQMAESNSPKS